MYSIVVKWCEFGPGVYQQYPDLLAEMFAYCLAAAHLQLSHQTALSFMVSDTNVLMEGWNYVDQLTTDEICLPLDPMRLPNVIHFCQRYGVGLFFFGKRRLPGSFLSCDSPLLLEPPLSLAVDHDFAMYPEGKRHPLTPVSAKRNAFIVCNMIRTLNQAAAYWKAQHCTSQTEEVNMNKSMLLVHIKDYYDG
jgi:peptidyl serine alpha-galactosyltransferase